MSIIAIAVKAAEIGAKNAQVVDKVIKLSGLVGIGLAGKELGKLSVNNSILKYLEEAKTKLKITREKKEEDRRPVVVEDEYEEERSMIRKLKDLALKEREKSIELEEQYGELMEKNQILKAQANDLMTAIKIKNTALEQAQRQIKALIKEKEKIRKGKKNKDTDYSGYNGEFEEFDISQIVDGEIEDGR